MKVCNKCGFKGNETDNFCPKCAGKMISVDENYANVSQAYLHQPEIKVSKIPFVVKLVVGIVALLAVSFYRLAGLECLVSAIAGALFSLCACMWYNKLSGFIPAFLFFLAVCFCNGHMITQYLCIIFMALEITAGVKIEKKLYL